MESLPYALPAVSLLLIACLTWQQYSHRRKISHLIDKLQRTARGEAPVHDLPADMPGLVNLSNAVRDLALAQQAQLSEVSAERARLTATLDQMTDGVLIVDANGLIHMANPASERLLGEGIPFKNRSVTVALRHHQLVETWQRCQQTGETQSESVELLTTRKFLQLIAIPDKKTGGALLMVQDLTRLRRLETVRRDFISNVSHELRTPLASLKALAETLQEGALDDPPAARRFVNRMQTEVDALTQMAAELLELSRIESGQVPLELKATAPDALLHSASERMKTQAERAGIELLVDCAPGLPAVCADAPRLEQVLVNLIHNAIKFTPPGGEVRLYAMLDGKFIRFDVSDTGSGIDPDDLPRIFERFYKADRARSRASASGTGLGLSIARHIVEAHGGKIWAESEFSRGSSFYFTVPLA